MVPPPPLLPLPRRRPSSASSTATGSSSTRTWKARSTSTTPAPPSLSLSNVTAQVQPVALLPAAQPPTPTSSSSSSAASPTPLPPSRGLSYSSQDAMKRALERDDESAAQARVEAAKAGKGRKQPVGVVVTSEFGGEGGGEEAMFLGKRRGPTSPSEVSGVEGRDESTSPPPPPPPPAAASTPIEVAPVEEEEGETTTTKRSKLRHPSGSRGGRPSTWFGWGGQGGIVQDEVMETAERERVPHRREVSTPEMASTTTIVQEPVPPTPTLEPFPTTLPSPQASSEASSPSIDPSSTSPPTPHDPAPLPSHVLPSNSHTFLPGLAPTSPSHSLTLPYPPPPEKRSSWLRRIPIPLPTRVAYVGEVNTLPNTPAEGLTPVGEEEGSGSASGRETPTTPSVVEESGSGKEVERGRSGGGGGSWFFRSSTVTGSGAGASSSKVASSPVEEIVVAPPQPEVVTSIPEPPPQPLPALASEPPAAPPTTPSRLGWLSRATSTSTLRPAAALPVDATPPPSPPAPTPPPPPSAPEPALTPLVVDSTPLAIPPPTSSSWFRRTPSSTSLSSKPTAPAPLSQIQPQPSLAPPSSTSPTTSPAPSIKSNSSPSIPIVARKSSFGSSPSPGPSSYGSTRPIVPSSLGREVVTAEPESEEVDTGAGERAKSGGGGWWGYVPGMGGSGGGSRKDVVSMVQEEEQQQEVPRAEENVIEASPSASVVVEDSAATSAVPAPPPPATSSYLAWVWPTTAAAPSPTPSSLSPPATPPLVEEQPVEPTSTPTESSSTDLIVPSSSSVAQPTTYASWLSFIAAKALPPPTFSKPPPDLTDRMEVMDIDEETAPSSASSSLVVPSSPSTRPAPSPPASIRGKKSSTTIAAAPSSPNSLAVTPTSSRPADPLTSNKVSRSASSSTLKPPPPPNLVLPTFNDIFSRPPRNIPPPPPKSLAKKTLSVLGAFAGSSSFSTHPRAPTVEGGAGETKLEAARRRGRELPKEWSVLHSGLTPLPHSRAAGGAGGGGEIKRIVILSVHGWFPNAIVRYVAGEPTGTSSAFGKKMEEAVRRYLGGEGGEGGLGMGGGLEKLTVMPLEGEGKVEDRVDRLFKEYLSRPEWVEDLRCADAVLVATHSQGCPVSTHLLNRLYEQGHLRSAHNEEAVHRLENAFGPTRLTTQKRKGDPLPKVVMLGICGVHVGPLSYLNSSSVIMPYLQYFENAAAHELFEFQDTESAVSRAYTASLSSALDHGVKFVYVASLNDQVVPVYGAIFSPVSHPSILRVLHIDGAAYSASDFVTNLLIFCLQLRNAGLSDGGMVAHLSEVVASGLTGVGHSTAYKEDRSYDLAVRYLFETTPSKAASGTLEVEEFLATEAKNSYEIPWILRGIMEDPLVLELFGRELDVLRSGFEEWQPATAKMKDLRRKLEPLRPRQSRRVTSALLPNSSTVKDLRSSTLSRNEGGMLSPKL